MSIYQRLKNQNKFLPLFVFSASILVVTAILGSIVLAIIGGDKGIFGILAPYIMSDFGQVIYFTVNENPYVAEFNTMYLPLNLIFFIPFALICKGNAAFYELDNMPANATWDEKYELILSYNEGIVSTWQFWVCIISFYIISLTVIGLILYRMRKWESKLDFMFAYFSLICSGLFLFGLFRGTNVFISLIFILLFVWLYKSDKRWQREISIVCFAVAGVLKLYPLLFGVLLLKDKRFLDAAKSVVYFILLAVLPFAMYGDIFTTLKDFIYNLTNFVGGEDRLGDPMNISCFSLVCAILQLFKTSAAIMSGIAIFFTVLVLLCCVFVGLFSNSRFVVMNMIAIGMLIIPPVSYYYVSMFFVLALVYLIDEWRTLSLERKRIYAIYFSVMACLPLSASAWFFPQCIMSISIIAFELSRLIKTRKTEEEFK